MKTRDWILLTIGFLTSFLIVAYPEFGAMQSINELDEVWTPIQSSRLKTGDTYYYWPLSMEVQEGRFFVSSPSASHPDGHLLMQRFYSASAFFASLPAIVLEDPRWIYFFSLFGFFALYFMVGYLAGFYFTRDTWSSLLIATLFVWHYDFFRVLTMSFQWDHYLKVWTRFDYFFDYDFLTDRLRFMVTNVSNLISLCFVAMMVAIKAYPRWPLSLGLVFLGWLVSYTYPVQAVVLYEFLFFAFAVAAVLKLTAIRNQYLISGAGILLILLVTSYLPSYQTAIANTPNYSMTFDHSHTVGLSTFLSSFFTDRLLKKVSLCTIVLIIATLALSYKNPSRWFWSVTAAMTGIGNLIYSSLSGTPQVTGRLFFRGLLVFWTLWLFILLVEKLSGALKGVKFKDLALRPTVLVLCSLILTIKPLSGMINFEQRLAEKNYVNHKIPKAQWEVYEWLHKNTKKNETVLAIDWDDLYLIPMFTHNNLFVSQLLLDNRPREEGLQRYFSLLHHYKIPEERVLELIEQSCPQGKRWRRGFVGPWKDIQLPFISRKDFQAAVLPFAFFNWPFAKNFNDIPLCEKDGETSEHLKKYLIDLYRATKSSPLALEAEWILVNKEGPYGNQYPENTCAEEESVFQNAYARICRWKSNL